MEIAEHGRVHGVQALERNRQVLQSLSGTSFNPSSANIAALQKPLPPPPVLELPNNAYAPEQYALPSRTSDSSSNSRSFEYAMRSATSGVGASADTVLA
jgi:hypothetical protein